MNSLLAIYDLALAIKDKTYKFELGDTGKVKGSSAAELIPIIGEDLSKVSKVKNDPYKLDGIVEKSENVIKFARDFDEYKQVIQDAVVDYIVDK